MLRHDFDWLASYLSHPRALDGATHAISQLTLPIPFPFAWLLSRLFFLITIRFQSVLGKHVKLFTLGANVVVAKNKEG